MRITIRPAPGWPLAQVALARRRLEFALGRFAGRVRSLDLRLTDENGPRGGLDRRCRLVVRLTRPYRLIVIEDVDSEGDALVSRAAERAARAVARAIDAAREWPRAPRLGTASS